MRVAAVLSLMILAMLAASSGTTIAGRPATAQPVQISSL